MAGISHCGISRDIWVRYWCGQSTALISEDWLVSRFHPFLRSPVFVLELKLQLQSSFEVEESCPEEQCDDPDTPVVFLPDQLGALAEPQQTAPTQENQHSGSPNCPVDHILNTSCPLTDKLRDLRLESMRYRLVLLLFSILN